MASRFRKLDTGSTLGELTQQKLENKLGVDVGAKDKKDPRWLACAMSLDLSVIVGAKVGQIDDLATILQKAADEILSACEKRGIEAYVREGLVRPLRHEELLLYKPRKMHYGKSEHVCETPHVSKRKLTEDWNKVTCKLCLKQRP